MNTAPTMSEERKALEKWLEYDAILRRIPGTGPIYGGQLRHVDEAYDDCLRATYKALAKTRGDQP